MDRLQSIPGIGKCPGDNDGHRIIDVSRLHLLLDVNVYNTLIFTHVIEYSICGCKGTYFRAFNIDKTDICIALTTLRSYLCASSKKHQIKDVTPYQATSTSKKVQVQQMFDRIARHYDFLNHALSLGIDMRWRKKAVAQLGKAGKGNVLDVATGTGDVAFMITQMYPEATVTGIDLADQMLVIARQKSTTKSGGDHIRFLQGDSENLPFQDNSYQAVTVAFGVRNFEDLQQGLREMFRVVMPGGKVVILEFSKPRAFPFKQIFNGYFRYLLPALGALRSKDSRAYRYLYESVQAFPDREHFIAELERAGWENPKYESLSLGICAIYTATK